MYRVSIFPKEGTRYNPIHEEFDNQSAKIIDLTEGDRGLFEGWSKYDEAWVTIHTSTIEQIEYPAEDCIKVTTRNTVYLFEEEF